MKLIIFAIIFTLSSINLIAQKEFNNWYFGYYAGITFNTYDSFPIALKDSAMRIASNLRPGVISDNNGVLLFYTNGKEIYNRNHSFMKNGILLTNLYYDVNDVMIIQNPSNSNLYYVFYIYNYYYNSNNDTLAYSVVDIRLDSGYGKVIEKNIILNINPMYSLAAVFNEDRTGVWLVATGNGNYSTYLIQNNEVTRVSNENYAQIGYSGSENYFGVKISPNGKIIAAAYNTDIKLFTFDRKKGILKLNSTIKAPSSEFKFIPGLEFSPDASKIYVHYYKDNLGVGKEAYYQYDVSKGYYSSKFNIIEYYDSLSTERGQMQLAPDGRIYFPSNRTLGTIYRPNVWGYECGIYTMQIDLEGRKARLYLPKFNASYFYYDAYARTPVYEGDSIQLYTFIPNYSNVQSIQWTGPNDFKSDEANPVINNVTKEYSGTYSVSIYTINEEFHKSLDIEILDKPINAKILSSSDLACVGDTVLLSAYPQSDTLQYLWSTQDTTMTIKVTKSDNYSVVIKDEFGVSSQNSYYINFRNMEIDGDAFEPIDFDSLIIGTNKTITRRLINKSDTTIIIKEIRLYLSSDEISINTSKSLPDRKSVV